ncbi:MAG: DUF2500 domain-containing protein [Clostridiales bacterium]|nr:DUF2500 domain-containing protein [Clostridiales bacterium]
MTRLIFLIVIAIAVVYAVRAIRQWSKNNRSPRLTVPATVVGKRMDVSTSKAPVAGDISGAHGYSTTSSTTYYVTFQVQSGDRMELRVGGKDYGLLTKGDAGNLTFQGTRFLSFDRFER